MIPARRIELFSNCPIPRGKAIKILFEGKEVPAYEGEPLAVALLAAGVQVFSRSSKYHRPRGPFCLLGQCSSCLMRVDGEPNIRTCQIPCRDGLRVERQAGWPSAQFDLFRAIDFVYGERLDHHSLLSSPAALNRLAARFVRRLSGYGQLPEQEREPLPFRELVAEAVVIGAGPAGLAAAVALAAGGRKTMLLEAAAHPGGRLLDNPEGFSCLAELMAELKKHPNVIIHTSTPVVAVYPDNLQVLATAKEQTLCLRPQRLVICTGDYEQTPPLAENDLPGIFSLRALERMVFLFGVVPPEPVALSGHSTRLAASARRLKEAGVKLAGVACSDEKIAAEMKAAGLPVLPGLQACSFQGGKSLSAMELAPAGNLPLKMLECASAAVESPAAPAYELAYHAGCRVKFRSEGGFFVATDESGQTSHHRIFAAGHLTGTGSADWAMERGRLAAESCLKSWTEDSVAGRASSARPAGC
jgi:sarcosine oxidase subunit alpha